MTEGILVAFLGAIRPTEDQIKDEDSMFFVEKENIPALKNGSSPPRFFVR